MKVCSEPGCPNLTDHGRCASCRAQAEQQRGRPADRGYDTKWRRNRARFIAANPTCTDCPAPATVADHAPRSRRELLAAGERHPDAWQHLQPRCTSCHNRRTAREQPGGWNAT